MQDAATGLVSILAIAGLGAIVGRWGGRLDGRQREVAFWIAVSALTAAGAWLRCVDLSAPFCDSGQTARVELATSDLIDILTFRAFDHRHPPVTALLTKLGLALGGRPWTLRLPFLLASVAALPLVALLGRRLGGRMAGVGAVAVVALSEPLAVMPREMKSHALLPLAAVSVLLLWLYVLERPSRKGAAVLGVVDGIAVWMHYMAPFIVLPQVLGLLDRRRRGDTVVTLASAAVVAALPLVRIATNMIHDVRLRAIASEHPEAVWGANTVGDVAASGVEVVGPGLLACLVALALAGSVHLVRRPGAGERTGAAGVAIAAWILPAVILAVTPVFRVLGEYLRLAIPLLAVVAAVGGVRLARVVARVTPPRWMGTCRGALAWALALAAGVLAAGQLARGFPRDLYRFAGECDHGRAAEVMRAGGPREVVLVHGHSDSLVGWYLDGLGDVERVGLEREMRYGDWKVAWLVEDDELAEGWHALAEERMGAIAGARQVWLLDLRPEPTWPGLERAGGCRTVESLEDVRVLMCGR